MPETLPPPGTRRTRRNGHEDYDRPELESACKPAPVPGRYVWVPVHDPRPRHGP